MTRSIAQRRRSRQRGAAMLVAMVLLTVVATLASGMVWQQWRAVQVETAERSRVQTAWMLHGGLDYARLILREDQQVSERNNKPTHLNAPWATPLQETKVSTMLAIDRDNNADTDLQAFLSGDIADAQARYNLRQLVVDGKLVKAQVEVLARLCASAGLPTDVAERLAGRFLAALLGTDPQAPLMPQTVEDLGWLGLEPDTLRRLLPLVVLLPQPTPVNLNTASREVLAAVIPGLDLGSADRLVQARSREPFNTLDDATRVLGAAIPLPAGQVDVRSAYFQVHGRMRLEDRLQTERFLVQRRPGLDVRTLQRLRDNGFVGDER
jgi:general secretion pathway protein K